MRRGFAKLAWFLHLLAAFGGEDTPQAPSGHGYAICGLPNRSTGICDEGWDSFMLCRETWIVSVESFYVSRYG